MRLYLIRHAATYPSDPVRWPDDGLRPLTSAGMEELREAAAGLERIAGSVDAVLASPLVRTRQTAAILAETAGWPSAATAPQLAPGRPPAEALAIVRELERCPVIALVGHEPNLLELISLCLAADDARVRCEIDKGGAACLDFPDAAKAGMARLQWLLTRRALRALAVR